MTNLELLTCPFCGSEALKSNRTISQGGDFYHVYVVSCGNKKCLVSPSYYCKSEGGYSGRYEESKIEAYNLVIKAWNLRKDEKTC